MDLRGKVALVTGASRGVGAATAIALAQAGCDVACAARSTRATPQRTPGTLDETVARIEAAGRRGLAIPTNLAVRSEVEQMVQRCAQHFGRLDLLVNNAAITFTGDLDIPLKRHDLILEVDLNAPLIALREALPHLRAQGGGAVVNVSSLAAITYQPALMSYGIAKAGLERLTLHAANELARDRIAVNCFRIDIPVASEGFLANTVGADHSNWEPPEVAAEGIVWLLSQPRELSGRLFSMYQLRVTQGIMRSRVAKPWEGAPPLGFQAGLIGERENIFS
jgi:NAD(P)-dependent dehydrogenase (short-subunit alcohol dehydrogenase family)